MSRLYKLASPLLVLIVVSQLAFAQEVASPASQHKLYDDGVLKLPKERSFSGTLTDTDDLPIGDARLAVVDQAGNLVGGEVITDEAGKFSFEGIDVGSYSIIAEAKDKSGAKAYDVIPLQIESPLQSVGGKPVWTDNDLNEDVALLVKDNVRIEFANYEKLHYISDAKALTPEQLAEKALRGISSAPTLSTPSPLAANATAGTTASTSGGMAGAGGGTLGAIGGLGGLLGLGGLAAGIVGIAVANDNKNDDTDPVSTGAAQTR